MKVKVKMVRYLKLTQMFVYIFALNVNTVKTLNFTKLRPSVVTVSKYFLSVGFGRFCRKNLGFRFGLGFHDKHVVNFFMTRVIWHDFHHH